MRKLLFAICGCVLLMSFGTAQGMVADDGTTTLISEDFESYAVGTTPTSWTQAYGTPTTVIDAAANGSYYGPARAPDPYSGEKCMEQSVQWDPGNTRAGGGSIAYSQPVNTGGTIIHHEWMMYLDPAAGADLMVTIDNGYGHLGDPSGQTNIAYYTGSAWVYINDWVGGNPIVRGQWQKWELKTQVGATNSMDRWWLTVDGVTHAGPVDPWVRGGGSPGGRDPITSLFIGTEMTLPNQGGLWLDAVPEPATIGLLAIGGLSLLRRRRA